ncbi:MAG: N-acetylmuramoyl-L-alanine amidase, partial [Clostridia bacterium]|nr:N-acetylmuramoyl-L-alanine amidase [Clostridia bacterium]
MNKTVFLNAGHGGSDPGAAANGFKEKDLNLSIAISCRDELLRHSVSVIMARDKDTDITSSEIIKMCNSSNASLAVDIHNNAGKGDGAEVYYYSGGGVSKELAEAILAEIVKLGQNSRGIKTRVSEDGSDYYYFIRETVPPAVIVECAFVDNREDMKIIDTKAEQQAMGKAIAKGILKVLEIPFKKETAVQKENFEVASVQALLRQAYAQGIVKTLVKTIDNK